MTSARFLVAIVMWALAASVFAQGKGGVFGPLEGTPGARREGRDSLRPPSNPGLAAPLDIRIQGEGISLPPGVSEDEPVSKPAEDRAPQRSAPPDDPSKPDAKRP
jgi:hypothetical protein